MADFRKDPDARLDYIVDWSDWLDGSSDFIVSARASAQTGIIIDQSSQTSTIHTFWVSGGTVGEEYEIVSRIATNGGRNDERTIIIIVEHQ